MQFSLSPFVLCLAQTRIEAMNQAFRAREPADSTGYALLAIGVLSLLVSIVIFLVFKQRTSRVISDSQLLFRELCRAHHLSWRARHLLQEMARVKKLNDPCVLLLDGKHWILNPETEAKLCTNSKRNRIQKLQPLLFAPAKIVS